MHNKKAIKKFIAIILMSILMCSFFAVITFAEETSEVRYVTSEDVNLVFDKYLTSSYFTPLSDSDTVTKSKLYKNMVNTLKNNYSTMNLNDELPIRIVLDLTNYPNDMITEDDLFMYIDEFKKEEGQVVQIKFYVDSFSLFYLITIMLLFALICKPSIPDIPNYSSILRNIELNLSSIKDSVFSKK